MSDAGMLSTNIIPPDPSAGLGGIFMLVHKRTILIDYFQEISAAFLGTVLLYSTSG